MGCRRPAALDAGELRPRVGRTASSPTGRQEMNRWLGVLGALCLTVTSTGCLRHQTRKNCSSCSGAPTCSSGQCGGSTCGDGACGSGHCQSGGCGDCGDQKVGLLNRIRSGSGNCGTGCRNGCVAGPLGWQQGGLNYSSHLQPGLLGHGAGAQLNNRPFNAGPPTGQVAYPYYSVRGPRDFFVNDPPTIGR